LSRSRLALAAACAATLVLAPSAFADNSGITPRDFGAKRFTSGVSVPEIVDHQVALQRIATLNDDTREVFSPGYQESLDYVVSTLRDAGYNPKVTPFNYPFWKETQPPVLNMVAPTAKTTACRPRITAAATSLKAETTSAATITTVVTQAANRGPRTSTRSGVPALVLVDMKVLLLH